MLLKIFFHLSRTGFYRARNCVIQVYPNNSTHALKTIAVKFSCWEVNNKRRFIFNVVVLLIFHKKNSRCHYKFEKEMGAGRRRNRKTQYTGDWFLLGFFVELEFIACGWPVSDVFVDCQRSKQNPCWIPLFSLTTSPLTLCITHKCRGGSFIDLVYQWNWTFFM